jgi:hypothetical protein
LLWFRSAACASTTPSRVDDEFGPQPQLEPQRWDSEVRLRAIEEHYSTQVLFRVLLQKIAKRLLYRSPQPRPIAQFNDLVFDRPELHGGGLYFGQNFPRFLVRRGFRPCEVASRQRLWLLLTVSHQFKNPLQPIRLFVRSIHDGTYDSDSDRKRDRARRAEASVERRHLTLRRPRCQRHRRTADRPPMLDHCVLVLEQRSQLRLFCRSSARTASGSD